jgi:hypothetical protein
MTSALELLQALGYESAGTDPDDRQLTQWTYQRTLPHVVISLPADACVMDVHYAIYDAGRRAEWQAIKEAQDTYARKLRVFGGTEIILPTPP